MKRGFFGFWSASLVVKILIVIALALLVMPALMALFPVVRYVMIIIIVFFIYDIVSKAFGNNVLTYLFTGVLLYFLIYKYLYVTTIAVIFYFMLSIGIMSMFVWGTKSLFGHKKPKK
jgi:hypothetical protein